MDRRAKVMPARADPRHDVGMLIRRRCPLRCASAPCTSPSPTSTAPSPGMARRSACACTGATPASPSWATGTRRARPARGSAGPPAGRHAGLYHYALLYPSREELARAALRLAATRTPIQGASDHRTHEAIYLPDPDGNGIELAADRPRDRWPAGLGYDGGPAPLDFDALLATVEGETPPEHVGPGLAVGHLHLHVGDVERGLAFYRDVLGFEQQADLGRPPSSPPAVPPAETKAAESEVRLLLEAEHVAVEGVDPALDVADVQVQVADPPGPGPRAPAGSPPSTVASSATRSPAARRPRRRSRGPAGQRSRGRSAASSMPLPSGSAR